MAVTERIGSSSAACDRVYKVAGEPVNMYAGCMRVRDTSETGRNPG